uniref:Hemopexin n=1 Tax=Latimeria chalumnae TaxID=7897 RepID=H3AHS3_LATCH
WNVPPGMECHFAPSHCPGWDQASHGTRKNTTLALLYNRCSNTSFDAFSVDNLGRIYAFRSNLYFRLDSKRDGWHPWSLNHTWKDLHGTIDAAFNWEQKMYFIQSSQVSIYRSDQGYHLIQGYPKSIKEELGYGGDGVDAAFICTNSHDLHIIKGNKKFIINLLSSPKVPLEEKTILHSHVDGAMCISEGVILFDGPHYYKYASADDLITATEIPPPHSIAKEFVDCQE